MFQRYLLTAHRPRRLARHDWGTQLAYEAARERPDVFSAVIGITIPVKFPPPLGPVLHG